MIRLLQKHIFFWWICQIIVTIISSSSSSSSNGQSYLWFRLRKNAFAVCLEMSWEKKLRKKIINKRETEEGINTTPEWFFSGVEWKRNNAFLWLLVTLGRIKSKRCGMHNEDGCKRSICIFTLFGLIKSVWCAAIWISPFTSWASPLKHTQTLA